MRSARMAGLHGYFPQTCDVYDSHDDAAAGLADIHGLGKHRRATLRRDGYLELNLRRDGNEYCEILECECDDPMCHSERM
jgi:hypothetical protein